MDPEAGEEHNWCTDRQEDKGCDHAPDDGTKVAFNNSTLVKVVDSLLHDAPDGKVDRHRHHSEDPREGADDTASEGSCKSGCKGHKSGDEGHGACHWVHNHF